MILDMIPLTMRQRESSSFYYMLAVNYRQESKSFRRKRDSLREYFDIVITQEMALGLLANTRDTREGDRFYIR